MSLAQIERTAHPPKEGTPLDPAFPTSADYPAIPEPAQSIREQVLAVQARQYHAYARNLRAGVYGRASEEVLLADLADRAARWRAVGARPSSWWSARTHLHPLRSDWHAEHICAGCLRETSFVFSGLCRACEPVACCEECGRLEPVRDLAILDLLLICPRCADVGEPVEAAERPLITRTPQPCSLPPSTSPSGGNPRR